MINCNLLNWQWNNSLTPLVGCKLGHSSWVIGKVLSIGQDSHSGCKWRRNITVSLVCVYLTLDRHSQAEMLCSIITGSRQNKWNPFMSYWKFKVNTVCCGFLMFASNPWILISYLQSLKSECCFEKWKFSVSVVTLYWNITAWFFFFLTSQESHNQGLFWPKTAYLYLFWTLNFHWISPII